MHGISCWRLDGRTASRFRTTFDLSSPCLRSTRRGGFVSRPCHAVASLKYSFWAPVSTASGRPGQWWGDSVAPCGVMTRIPYRFGLDLRLGMGETWAWEQVPFLVDASVRRDRMRIAQASPFLPSRARRSLVYSTNVGLQRVRYADQIVGSGPRKRKELAVSREDLV